MSVQLIINQKTDSKLVEQFPNDPDFDITITLHNNTLHLVLAYLAMDSPFFAELPPTISELDLSHLEETSAIAVLRSLYGGSLECSSTSDLENLLPVIKYLRIEQYLKTIEEEIKNLLVKRDGAPGSLEWVEVSLKNRLLEEWIIEWLSQQHLRVLESTKNYLQIGKLSTQSLNFILLEYHRKNPEKTAVVNTILENYFNRKGLSPNNYFQSPELTPLKTVWEKYHHKFKGIKLEKISSIQNLIATTATSPRLREEPKTALRNKKTPLGDINTLSLNLTGDLLKGQVMSDSSLLDLRLSVLVNELEQKTRRIQTLKQELQELEELKAKRNCQQQALNEESMLDIALLKSRMRSKREKHLHQESTNQYALDSACKKMLEQEQKAKLIAKEAPQKKA